MSVLELHVDASKIEGLEDGAQVSTWSDLSGKGRNLTQATASKRPIYKTNIQNGLPVVRTADADDALAITAAAWGAAVAQPTTIFVVTKRIGAPKVAGIFDGFVSPTQNDLFYNASGQYGMYAGTVFETGVSSDTAFHLLTVIFNGASSILRIDGEQVATGNAGTQSLDGFVLGNDSTLGNGIAQDIGELRVYSGLTAEERTTIEEALLAKWEEEHIDGQVLPPASATASAPNPTIALALRSGVAPAIASAPTAEVATGPMPSPTDHKRGLPLPFPSVLANPARLGPPRFTAIDRKTLGVED